MCVVAGRAVQVQVRGSGCVQQQQRTALVEGARATLRAGGGGGRRACAPCFALLASSSQQLPVAPSTPPSSESRVASRESRVELSESDYPQPPARSPRSRRPGARWGWRGSAV
jgi:hypothetical protein